jgi:hypothetical protein
MIWILVFLFMVVAPAGVAYQSGRWESLAIPILLIVVCAQWVAVDDGEGHGFPGAALGLAIISLLACAYAVALSRRRRQLRR